MKFCEKCGKELLDDAVVCMGCGCSVPKTATPAPKNSAAPAEKESKTSSPVASAGVVIGIIGIIAAWLIALLGYMFGGAGLICAIVAKKKNPMDKKAKTALGLSLIALGCSIINSIIGVMIMM